MADHAPPRQGWQVPQRTPAIAALAVLGLVAVLLTLAGWFYEHRIAPRRHRPVKTFPAPGIETYVHDGQGDPHRPRVEPRPDPALDAAKRAVVAEGLTGWRR